MAANRFSNSRRASRFVGKSDLEPSTSERSILRIWPFSITSSRHRPTHTGFLTPLRNTRPLWYLRRANPPPRSPNRCPRPGRVTQLLVVEAREPGSSLGPEKAKSSPCSIRERSTIQFVWSKALCDTGVDTSAPLLFVEELATRELFGLFFTVTRPRSLRVMHPSQEQLRGRLHATERNPEQSTSHHDLTNDRNLCVFRSDRVFVKHRQRSASAASGWILSFRPICPETGTICTSPRCTAWSQSVESLDILVSDRRARLIAQTAQKVEPPCHFCMELRYNPATEVPHPGAFHVC